MIDSEWLSDADLTEWRMIQELFGGISKLLLVSYRLRVTILNSESVNESYWLLLVYWLVIVWLPTSTSSTVSTQYQYDYEYHSVSLTSN